MSNQENNDKDTYVKDARFLLELTPFRNGKVVTDEQWNAQVLRLARRIPELGVPPEKKGIVDLYDVSDDWIPIYDRTDLDGFYVAIGSSGNQFKNAPVAAYCMAELIEAVEGGHDHDADPVTTNCHRIGRPLDLGAFSRLRSMTTTTGTVMG